MDSGIGQFWIILPWLLAVIVPAGIALFFVRQLNIARQETDKTKEDANLLQTEIQVMSEKLANVKEVLERERHEAHQRFSELSVEKNELKSSYENLQEKNSAVQADLAAAEAKLPDLILWRQSLPSFRTNMTTSVRKNPPSMPISPL